jgi:hypothetical protein
MTQSELAGCCSSLNNKWLSHCARKYGLRDWVRVAEDLQHRGRSQCRNRFQYIYTVFKRNPLKSLENIVYGTVKAAHRKQRQTLAGLDETFRSWLSEQANGSLTVGPCRFPGVDPDGRSVLPNGMTVVNRDLCRFIRYLQARLAAPEARPLERLPPPRQRTLPTAEDELPDRPLKIPRCHILGLKSLSNFVNNYSCMHIIFYGCAGINGTLIFIIAHTLIMIM